MTSPNPAAPNPWPERWQRFSAAALRGFHAYASWLVSISWKRFLFLSLLLLIVANLLQSLPPFSWRVTETIEDSPVTLPLPKPPAPPAAPMEPTAPKPSAHAKGPGAASAPKDKGVDINVQIDEKGIRITPREKDTPEPEPAASAAEGGIEITVPANVDKAAIREAVEEAKAAIREAIANQKEAAREAAEAAREAARAAREAGAEVTLVAGPVHLPTPRGVCRIDVRSAQNMFAAVQEYAQNATILIAAAAVADWRPANAAEQKIKKDCSGDVPALGFVENPDILATVAQSERARAGQLYCVGFAAESENLLAHASAKRARKGVPLLVGNIGPATFGQDDNALLLIDAEGSHELPRASKAELGRQLVTEIARRLQTQA